MSKYIFGPVPSRRLGRSLGVDLVPLKTCSYDCIYCQLGRTTRKTTERKEWVPLESVLEELEENLASEPDYITLSGSGEPTLYSRCDELIDRIKAMTNVPVAVLTNGSLLWQEAVRKQLLHADLVIPSLDAGDEAMFRLVNRPHEDVSFERTLSGLVDLRREFRGGYWLEVFVLGAHTAIKADFSQLVKCIDLIGPDCVQLNTVTRPPAESFAIGISRERLTELARMFNPPAEVIADFRGVHEKAEFTASREDVLGLLRRRPCSMDDIAIGLGMHRNEVVKYVEHLSADGLLLQTRTEGRLYYRAV
ncbi:MAG: radical SAM protein [Candidatus Nealsonbacteria bacterium]|nr:radical SAM protein [Candidatus Nealsonbacteria bacterium]